MNLRAKGSVQVFDWLKVENNMEFSNMDYHNPINVGEGGSIWRNIADEGHPSSPIFNPDGSLTFSAAYTVGDFIYGKNGLDTNNRVLRNTTGFTASFLEINYMSVETSPSVIQITDKHSVVYQFPIAHTKVKPAN